MEKVDCTQSDAQRLEPISETESITREERSWSPTVAEYTRCLVHGSITRLAELKDRWNKELGIFTELEKDDPVQSCLEERFEQGPVSLHTFIENDAKGVALILLDFQAGSSHSCEIECMVYNCMEQQVSIYRNRQWGGRRKKDPADLDALCDHHEIARLKAMGVIYQPESGNENCKSLTVKFEISVSGPGIQVQSLYMSRKGYALLACDISDAYLTCEQPCPTVVTLHGTTYRLAFMLPGQRDGSAVWFSTFTKYLVSEGGVSLWPGCEALFAMRNHSGGGLLHVDDLLGSGEHAELQRLAQIIESKYKCTLEWLVREGDSLHFLKRKHTLARQDLLCIQKADKHIMSDPLPEDQVSVYRSCVGILMYISADTADMQHSIRMLSQHLACPTEACMKALKHLVRYAKSTSGFCLGLERTHAGHGTRVQCDTGADVLELYTDSGWASDHTARRSVSAGALYLNGNAIYTASRTQRVVVAMSSCESELNALVSFAVDLMYVKEALRFIVGVTPESHAFSDSSSARAVVNKQGLSKLKHVEIRLLWVQQALKDGAFKLHPVGTLDNSSDLMTKVLKRERILYLMYLLNIRDGDAQFNRVGEAQAVARDNNLSLKLAVKAVKAFRGPPQRVHALLQALTFMSLIDANQARMLDSESRPHVLESALSGCGFILVCIGCLAVLCMSLQGCQAEIADELPDPWVVWFTLIIGFLIGLGFWFVLLSAEPQQQMPCEPDDATTPACDDDAPTLSDDIPSDGELAQTLDVTRASSDEPLSEPTQSDDGAGDGNSHPASPTAHDPIDEPENHALAAVPIAVVDPPAFPAAVDQLLVYHAPISGRRWHVFRGCWGLSRAAVVAEEELGVLLRRDPRITMCLICMNRVRNDLRFPMLRITDGADDPRREHPEPEPFQ
ncbi:unnamed protein product [Symbiodinium sp. CCMP2592]|nr:unnamed protein product [Symbiodinium sp. CCMP2592]